MTQGNVMGVQEKVEAGVGFQVGDYNLGRLDRWSDADLETLQDHLTQLIGEAQAALEAVSRVQQQRYDVDTVARVGRYAIE